MRISKPSIFAQYRKLTSFEKGRFLTTIGMALYCYAFAIVMAYLITTIPDKYSLDLSNIDDAYLYQVYFEKIWGVVVFLVISFLTGLYCEWHAFKTLTKR